MSDFKDEAGTLKTDPSISRLQDQIMSVIREHDCFVNRHGDVIGCICGQEFGKDFSTTEFLWDQHVADAVIAALPELRPSRRHLVLQVFSFGHLRPMIAWAVDRLPVAAKSLAV